MKALILARVSTREQMEEGQSIPSQMRKMRDYCSAKNLEIAEEFEITESSSKDTRKEFSKIIEIIKKSKEQTALIIDTVDRLQRSFRESVILDDLIKEEKIEIHFLRENLVLNKNSNSSEFLRWDMAVMFARSYILQLGDNVKRTQKEKIRNGEFPSKAPLGYKNVTLDDERKDIVIDTNRAHLVKKSFQLYASGKYSVKLLAKEMKKQGLTNFPSRKPVTTSQIHNMLKNPFYFGEMKKKKYIYYHCTNYHGNCNNVVWISEKDLLAQVQREFNRMRLPEDAVQELKTELRRIHESEQEFFTQSKNVLEQQLTKIRNRYAVMYEDRLDGRISTEDYDKRLVDAKTKESDLMSQLSEHSKANQDFYLTAGKVIDLSQRAWKILEVAEVEEKTQLITFALQNFSLRGKNLVFETKNPFQGVIDYQKTGKLLRVTDSIRTSFAQ